MAVDLSTIYILRVECAFAYRALRGDEYLTGRDNGAVLLYQDRERGWERLPGKI